MVKKRTNDTSSLDEVDFSKIAVIFCTGESINSNLDIVHSLLNNKQITKVGVNLFPIKFKEKFKPDYYKKSMEVDYWGFSDDEFVPYFLENYENQKTIINAYLSDYNLNALKEKCNVDYIFKHANILKEKDVNNSLYGLHSTTLKLIHLFLIRGYYIVVVGMDNNISPYGEWKHFYEETYHTAKADIQIKIIKSQLRELSSMFKRVYKIDPTNNVDVPLIDAKELLKGNLVNIDNNYEIIEIKPTYVKAVPDELIKKIPLRVKTEVIDKEYYTMRVPPQNPKDGVMVLDGIEYIIKNCLLDVKNIHVRKLLKLGFNLE